VYQPESAVITTSLARGKGGRIWERREKKVNFRKKGYEQTGVTKGNFRKKGRTNSHGRNVRHSKGALQINRLKRGEGLSRTVLQSPMKIEESGRKVGALAKKFSA